MPQPIRVLAQEFMKAPREIAVAAVSKPIEAIEQEIIMVDQSRKSDLLVDLLATRDVERAIVFTRTKRGTDKVERMLNDAGLRSIGLHGDKSQGQRNKALHNLKQAREKFWSPRMWCAGSGCQRCLPCGELRHAHNSRVLCAPHWPNGPRRPKRKSHLTV